MELTISPTDSMDVRDTICKSKVATKSFATGEVGSGKPDGMKQSEWVAMTLVWFYVNYYDFEMSADDMYACLAPCTKADLVHFYHALATTTGMGIFGHKMADVKSTRTTKKQLLEYIRQMVDLVTDWRKEDFKTHSQWTWYNKHDPSNPDPDAGIRSSWPRLAPVWESKFIVVP